MALSRSETADQTIAQYPHHTFVNNDPEDYSPFFTWRNCELCDGLAGSRYNVTAVVIGLPRENCEDSTQYNFEVCEDCMHYVAYGETW